MTNFRRGHRAWAISLCMILLGCSPKARPNFDSPEACYKALMQARQGKDPALRLVCFSEALQNYVVGSLAFELERASTLSDGGEASASCAKILQQQGLENKDIMGFLQLVDSPVPGGAIVGYMQIGDTVHDPESFVRETSAALADLQKLTEEKVALQGRLFAKSVFDPAANQLSHLKVDGNTAQGTVTSSEMKDKKPESIYFKREHDSWVIAMGPSEPDWRKPIQGRFLFREYIKTKK